MSYVRLSYRGFILRVPLRCMKPERGIKEEEAIWAQLLSSVTKTHVAQIPSPRHHLSQNVTPHTKGKVYKKFYKGREER